jgi:protein-arginine kinase activator protein McsA
MKAPILVSSNIMEEAGVDQDSIKEVKKTIIKPEISVQNLKEKLKLAVEEEEYETAAILRDKISLLEP